MHVVNVNSGIQGVKLDVNLPQKTRWIKVYDTEVRFFNALSSLNNIELLLFFTTL